MTDDRFYGWVFGDNPRDKAVLAIYRGYQERGESFADYCKQLIYDHQNGDLVQAGESIGEQILHKLNEIERLIRSGALPPGRAVIQGTDDTEVYDLLSDIGT
jgi:hypothetical protein